MVEVDYTSIMLGTAIVGLPDASIQESRERVQAAVRNAGVPYPHKRLVVNLAPAALGLGGYDQLDTGFAADLSSQLPTGGGNEPWSIRIHTIEHYFRAKLEAKG